MPELLCWLVSNTGHFHHLLPKDYPFKQIFFKKLIFIILPVLISFGVANVIFKKAGESNERFSSTLTRFENANMKDASVSFRLKIWKNAIGFAKANPILGIGLDNWRVESIPLNRSKRNYCRYTRTTIFCSFLPKQVYLTD